MQNCLARESIIVRIIFMVQSVDGAVHGYGHQRRQAQRGQRQR